MQPLMIIPFLYQSAQKSVSMLHQLYARHCWG